MAWQSRELYTSEAAIRTTTRRVWSPKTKRYRQGDWLDSRGNFILYISLSLSCLCFDFGQIPRESERSQWGLRHLLCSSRWFSFILPRPASFENSEFRTKVHWSHSSLGPIFFFFFFFFLSFLFLLLSLSFFSHSIFLLLLLSSLLFSFYPSSYF